MNPRQHPNAYVGLSSALVSSFLVSEAKRRFGVDLSPEESGFIVACAVSGFLFAGRKLEKR